MSRLDDTLNEVRPRHPRAWIGGTCAELGDRFGLPIWLLRILFVLSFGEVHWFTGAVYLVVTMALRTRLADLLPAMSSPARSRSAPPPPDANLNLQRDRFGALELRLAALEAAVTSDELKLRARFRDIEG
jgi:phage shock protein PspC (stress-responsive transcriptional regulator)